MFTLHGTAKLLSKWKVAPGQPSAPTSRLGNWYANSIADGPRSPIVCVSERTLLPVVVKACHAKDFAREFADSLRALLLELGIAPDLVEAECAEMTSPSWAKPTDRSLIGVLNEQVQTAKWLKEDFGPDLAALRYRLSENIVKSRFPLDETRALFGVTKADRLEVVVVSAGSSGLRVRRLDDNALIRFMTRDHDQVPGEIITVQPEHQKLDGAQFMRGTVEKHELDVGRLGLKPLKLERVGDWNPRDHEWSADLLDWERQVIARGRRPKFMFEDIFSDDVPTSTELREAGRVRESRDLLHALLEKELRHLDAHAHLGNSYFNEDPLRAMRHYEVGVEIGQLSLGKKFEGVLPGSALENRPFLRCLHGWGLCLWRFGRRQAAAEVFTRLLWLNPNDNQGARFLLQDLASGRELAEDL